MGSSFFGWFERSSLWCPGRKPWVTKRCVWSSVWREPKTTENDFAGMRGEGGGVLPRGAGASGALVIVLEASGCGRRANGWCSMEFQFKEWVEPVQEVWLSLESHHLEDLVFREMCQVVRATVALAKASSRWDNFSSERAPGSCIHVLRSETQFLFGPGVRAVLSCPRKTWLAWKSLCLWN